MGRDKALLEVGGRSMLERAVSSLLAVTRRVRIVGRPCGLATPRGPLESLPDAKPGLGPLSGIHAALQAAEADAVLVLACDLPLVTPAFLRGLVEALIPEVEAVVPRPASGTVPVCAVYRRSCLPALEARIEKRHLSARGFAESLRARFLDEAALELLDPAKACLVNVNTPEEYDRVLRQASGRPGVDPLE
jgi:molybdopterin-guanine dinucleotide biosynthesis protein A